MTSRIEHIGNIVPFFQLLEVLPEFPAKVSTIVLAFLNFRPSPVHDTDLQELRNKKGAKAVEAALDFELQGATLLTSRLVSTHVQRFSALANLNLGAPDIMRKTPRIRELACDEAITGDDLRSIVAQRGSRLCRVDLLNCSRLLKEDIKPLLRQRTIKEIILDGHRYASLATQLSLLRTEQGNLQPEKMKKADFSVRTSAGYIDAPLWRQVFALLPDPFSAQQYLVALRAVEDKILQDLDRKEA